MAAMFCCGQPSKAKEICKIGCELNTGHQISLQLQEHECQRSGIALELELAGTGQIQSAMDWFGACAHMQAVRAALWSNSITGR
jgi:hypothetical protein